MQAVNHWKASAKIPSSLQCLISYCELASFYGSHSSVMVFILVEAYEFQDYGLSILWLSLCMYSMLFRVYNGVVEEFFVLMLQQSFASEVLSFLLPEKLQLVEILSPMHMYFVYDVVMFIVIPIQWVFSRCMNRCRSFVSSLFRKRFSASLRRAVD